MTFCVPPRGSLARRTAFLREKGSAGRSAEAGKSGASPPRPPGGKTSNRHPWLQCPEQGGGPHGCCPINLFALQTACHQSHQSSPRRPRATVPQTAVPREGAGEEQQTDTLLCCPPCLFHSLPQPVELTQGHLGRFRSPLLECPCFSRRPGPRAMAATAAGTEASHLPPHQTPRGQPALIPRTQGLCGSREGSVAGAPQEPPRRPCERTRGLIPSLSPGLLLHSISMAPLPLRG